MNENEHTYTDEIVCPHCGYQFNDSWELADDGEQEVTCEKCEEDFLLYTNIEITYSTTKKNKTTN